MRQQFNAIIVCVAVSASAAHGAVLLEPISYLRASDSPFVTMGLDVVLEDFEDGVLNAVGVSASSGVVRTPSINTNSVDADDGVEDGFGRDGHAFLDASGDDGVMFFFNSAAIGSMPTAVGIVYTDGAFDTTVTFEAFGPSGSLGTVEKVIVNTGSPIGRTDDDTFFGAIDPGGIIGIAIHTSDIGAMQIDHIQYVTGDIPEPASLTAAVGGLTLVAARRRKVRPTR